MNKFVIGWSLVRSFIYLGQEWLFYK